MAEKRGRDRSRKRLQVRFGINAPTQFAFTDDISPTGLFLRTGTIYAPGTVLQFQVATSSGESIRFDGKVMWAKRVPAAVVHKIKAGMGIRILRFEAGKELFLGLAEKTRSIPPTRRPEQPAAEADLN